MLRWLSRLFTIHVHNETTIDLTGIAKGNADYAEAVARLAAAKEEENRIQARWLELAEKRESDGEGWKG